MNRQPIILLLFLLLSSTLNAQFVTIPDTNFVAWLQVEYPNCMTGNQMDTTCVDITSEVNVNCNNESIVDFTGIEYFDNLQSFICSHNPIVTLSSLPSNLISFTLVNTALTSLPALPNGLTQLVCRGSNLASLPALPSSLIRLDCENNNLSSIPTLPANLEILQVSSNPLTTPIVLPNGLKRYYCNSVSTIPLPILPTSIEHLRATGCNYTSIQNLTNLTNCISVILSYNSLGTLPSLPPNLTNFLCEYCDLTSLPALPSSISKLEISNNNLTVLPTLPTNLSTLVANNNNISILPALPSSFMQTIEVRNNNLTSITNFPANMGFNAFGIQLDNNQLTQLPNFPNSVNTIRINNNLLANIPPLPDLIWNLQLENNNLTCLPVLPSTLNYVNFDGNPLSCLPNYINALNSSTWLSSLPLCQYGDLLNNSSGCSTAQGIEGYINNDIGNNCILNTGDFGVKNIIVNHYDSSNVQLASTSSSSIGRFFFSANPDSYTVEIDTVNKPYEVGCLYPGVDSSFTISPIDSLITDVNFLVKCKLGFDLGVQSVVPIGYVFPGQIHHLLINAGDISQWYGLNCAGGIGGTVEVMVSGPITYTGNNGTQTPSVSGSTYTYTIADFGSINILNNNFLLNFKTDTTAQSGDTICVTVTVNPTIGDYNLSNNTYTFCYEVLNSYDPNIKTVNPRSVKAGYNDWLTYTIHFQNIGSAPAFNIRLEDTLSANLNLSTFEVIGYSHLNNYHLIGDKLTVYYPNIMLPDSSTNEPNSKGYIQYRIKPISGLAIGAKIENTASIFFDYNDAIVTNTTVTSYNNNLSIHEISSKIDVKIYPNPARELFYIELDKSLSNLSIKIYDILGQEVKFSKQTIDDRIQIKVGDLAKGLLIIHIMSDQGIAQSKLILK